MASPRSLKIQQRRVALRDQFFPDAANLVWTRQLNAGYCSVPRTIPWIALLIAQLSTHGNPSGVYWDFWCRAFDEGVIEVNDEQEFAFSSGYTGNRALRTWKEHVKQLQKLGFIKVAPKGNREIGYILLLNPYLVVEHLKKQGQIPEVSWWTSFQARMAQIGAKSPTLPKAETKITSRKAS